MRSKREMEIFADFDSFGDIISSLDEGNSHQRRKKELHHNLEMLVNTFQVPMIIRNVEGKIFLWNTGAERMYGFLAKEVEGANINDILKSHFYESEKEILQKLRDNCFWKGEIRQYDRRGKEINVFGNWSAWRNREGDIKNVLEINFDITDYKKNIENIVFTNKKYKALFDEGTLAIQHSDAEGNSIITSEYFSMMLGYSSSDELESKNVKELYVEGKQYDEILSRIDEEKKIYGKCVVLKKKNGSEIKLLLSVRRYKDRLTWIYSEVDKNKTDLAIPICAQCNRIREGDADKGVWKKPADYFMKNYEIMKDPETEYVFTHGICNECMKMLYEDIFKKEKL